MLNQDHTYDESVQLFFKELATQLFEMMQKKDEELKEKLTNSHSFVDFFVANGNKAVYEVTYVSKSTFANVVLFSILNLYHYTEDKLKMPLPSTEKSDSEKWHLLEFHSAVQLLVHNIEAACAEQRDKQNTVIIGTDADQFTDEDDLEQRVDNIHDLIFKAAECIGIEKAIAPGKIIQIKDSESYNALRDKLFHLVNKDQRFEEIPMKFLFLRCFLHNIESWFITYQRFLEYAKHCDVDDDEVESFLEIFSKSCSLFALPKKERGLEHRFVILQPARFTNGLDLLYTKTTQNQYSEKLKNGLLPDDLARSIWSAETSESYPVSEHEFFTFVLTTSLRLMVKLVSEPEIEYFMPSLRSEYDKEKPTTKSDSMIITYNIPHVHFHKLCEFALTFSNFKREVLTTKLNSCKFYNVVEFSCFISGEKKATASVRFRFEYIELLISTINTQHHELETLHSFLKTACIEMLHEFCQEYENLRYRLAIVCPQSEAGNPHFIYFDPMFNSIENIKCDCGKSPSDLSSHPAILWVQSAYQGNRGRDINLQGI